MSLEIEMRIAINNSIPCEIISTAVIVAEKHIEISNLIAIQDYLLEHGNNDEKINDKIRKIQNTKYQQNQ